MSYNLPPIAETGKSGVEEAIKEAEAITIFACSALVAALSFNTPCRSFTPRAGFLKKRIGSVLALSLL